MEKDFIPDESKTIVSLRKDRLNSRKKQMLDRLRVNRAWWGSGQFEFLTLVFIFLLNFYVIYPFFGTYSESVTFSGPVIPVLVNILSVFGTPFYYSLRILSIVFYLGLPLTFYLLVKYVTGRKMAAFLATLMLSVPVSPFALSRINYSLLGSESPHFISLTIIPVAVYFLLHFLKEGMLKNLVFCALFSSLVVLISPSGFFMLLVFSILATFSEMLLGHGRLKFIRMIIILVVVAGLVSFWYNPHYSFSLFFGDQGKEGRATVMKLIPISMFSLPVLAVFGFLLFDRKPEMQPIFLASFFTLAFWIISAVGGNFSSSGSLSYVSEFGISLALLLGILIIKSIEYARTSPKIIAIFERFKIPKLLLNGGLLAIILMGMVVWTILGGMSIRSSYSQEVSQVLGVSQTNVLWEERVGSNTGLPAIWGYVLTLATVSFLIMPHLRARLQK